MKKISCNGYLNREHAIHGLFNGGCLCQQVMVKFKPFVAVLLATMAFTASADAQKARRGEQDGVYAAIREGGVRPLPNIENSIVPGMKARGAEYIGSEYDVDEARYRLKFMRGRSVIWIDVDGKSGNVVGRAGE
jgi:hypothetical protein